MDIKPNNSILTFPEGKGRKRGDNRSYLEDIGGISKPFRSRFMEFSLTPYSYDEFCEIAVNLLEKRYRHPEELSLKVADIVWNKLESKDVRDILTIGKLSNSVNDVDFIATTLQKYKRRNEV